jgi:hypothetical protein
MGRTGGLNPELETVVKGTGCHSQSTSGLQTVYRVAEVAGRDHHISLLLQVSWRAERTTGSDTRSRIVVFIDGWTSTERIFPITSANGRGNCGRDPSRLSACLRMAVPAGETACPTCLKRHSLAFPQHGNVVFSGNY